MARIPKLSLSTQILIAIGVGIVIGLFFGERVAFLEIVGNAFVQLLQMTVLPYVTVSLIGGLGSLSLRNAALLARSGGLVLVLIWGLTMVLVLLMPLSFPDWEAASFFSSALIEEQPAADLLAMYIPANPFHSLANNVVPAVVLFSLALGVALIGVPNKEPFLQPLAILTSGLTRITNFVIRLTPIGVLGIAAAAAGTLRPEDLDRLQVYLVSYLVLAIVLLLWVLPALVTSFTPLRYRDVVVRTRDILITALATGSVFVVLPLLAERSKQLLAEHGAEGETAEAFADVLVPTSYSFPSAGTVLTLSFVLFAGWYTGFPVSVAQYPIVAFSGLLSVFGGVYVSIPYLLESLRVPADTFQLLVVFNQIIAARIGACLAAMHTLVITLLCVCMVAGRARIRSTGLLRFAGTGAVLIAVSLLGVRLLFTYGVEHEYRGYRTFVGMELLGDPGPTNVEDSPPDPFPPRGREQSAAERIRETGVIRVGYARDVLPFVFRNEQGRLVGLDVQLAHELAHDLGARLEFVRVPRDRMKECLDAGYCDMLMSGFVVNPERAAAVSFARSHMDQTLALIVPDYRREEFGDIDAVRRMKSLRLGVPDVPYFLRLIGRHLPNAQIVPIETPREYFRGEVDVDALLYSAEAGSAWCLIYPNFSVAVPRPRVVAVPSAYAVARGDQAMLDTVNAWIELKQKDGTIRAAYDYWILGRQAEQRGPRWSVIRDVLGWVD